MRIYHLFSLVAGLLILSACTPMIVPPTIVVPATPLAILAAPCIPTPGIAAPIPTALPADLPSTITLAKPDEPGERLIVTGTVYAADCRTPLAGVFMEVWNANQAGKYTYLRGKLRSDEQGHFTIDTIKPGSYGIANHIHFIIYYPDKEPIATLLEFAGDPLLSAADTTVAVTALVAGEENGKPLLRTRFDIVLQDAKKSP